MARVSAASYTLLLPGRSTCSCLITGVDGFGPPLCTTASIASSTEVRSFFNLSNTEKNSGDDDERMNRQNFLNIYIGLQKNW